MVFVRRVALLVGLLLLAAVAWVFLRAWTAPPDDAATRNAPDAGSDVDAALLRGREAAVLGDDEPANAPGPPRLPPAESWEATGRVVRAGTETGIANAFVHLELVRGDLREPVGEVKTRGDGTFHLPLPRLDELSPAQLAASRLVAYVRAEGYWQEAHSKYPKTLYRVPADRRATGTIHLRPGRTVSGRVLDADGGPVAGAAVSISWRLSPTRRRDVGGSRYTDHAGEYRLPLRTLLRRDEAMVVSARKVGSRAHAHLLLPIDRDRPPGRIPDLIFERAGTGTITGRAVFRDGTPGADVDLFCCILRPDGPSATARARTDSEGRFEFQDLPSGDGYACASESPHQPYPEPEHFGGIDVATGARDVVLELARPHDPPGGSSAAPLRRRDRDGPAQGVVEAPSSPMLAGRFPGRPTWAASTTP